MVRVHIRDMPLENDARIRICHFSDLHLPPEKVFANVDRYGNTSAASIPIALDEAIQMGRIKAGSVVVFVAFGGGLTWGAAALRWGQRIEPIATSDAKLPPTKLSGVELLDERQSERRARRGVA